MNSNNKSFIRNISKPFIGPDATNAEMLISWIGSLIAFFVMFIYGYFLGWNIFQILVSSIFAFDIFGGIIVNSTTAGRKYWHSSNRSMFKQIAFLLLHIHPFIIAFMWSGYLFDKAFLLYLIIVTFSLLVMYAPKGLQKPISFGLTSVGIILVFYFLQMPIGLMWLPPLLIIKLVAAYSVSK